MYFINLSFLQVYTCCTLILKNKIYIFRYTELSQGRMPLGIKRVKKPKSNRKEMDSKKAALRLIRFEKNLFSDKVNKKRKRKNSKAICDQISVNDLKNGDASESDAIDSERKLTDTTSKADAVTDAKTLQDTDANTVELQIPLKKRKRSDSTCDIPNTKSEVIKNKKKLAVKTSKKSKATKIKFNQKGNKSTVDKNIKRKTTKTHTVQTSKDQYTSISPISSEKIPLKEINKPIESKKMSKNKHQKMPSKNVNVNLILYFALQ